MMKDKKWKKLKGFKNVKNGIYEISNYGDVRLIKTNEILKMKIANKKKHPYYAVYLKKDSGKKEWVLVHQLVAYCFLKIPKKYIGMDVELVPDHLDNNGLNNYYKNLKYKTRGENVSDAFKMGYCNNSGENNVHAIINDEQAKQICEYLEKNVSYDDIIKKMNFPDNKKYRQLLVRIKNKNAWNHISCNYQFNDTVQLNKKQRDMISKLPTILKLMDDGLSNSEIYSLLWEGDDKRESKMVSLRKIRKKEIYTEYL